MYYNTPPLPDAVTAALPALRELLKEQKRKTRELATLIRNIEKLAADDATASRTETNADA